MASQVFDDKQDREKWLNVVEQLKTGSIPPKGKPRPAADETKALIDWVDGKVSGRRQREMPCRGSRSCGG